MKTEWFKIDWVEVQAFTPDAPSRDAILFCTGFPGMGGALFENNHAQKLVKAGYSVFVIHHKGTRTNAPEISKASINNEVRLAFAQQHGETHLGGGPVTMDELLVEPFVLLRYLADNFKNVHIIGNSFGALAALWSMTQEGAPQNSVETLILLAGAQGVDDGRAESIMRIWIKEFLEMPHIKAQIDIPDTDAALQSIRNAYKALPQRVTDRLSPHIKLTYMVMKYDELLKVQDTMAFRSAIGGRGELMIDTEERGDGTYGAHFSPNLKTTDILKVIEA